MNKELTKKQKNLLSIIVLIAFLVFVQVGSSVVSPSSGLSMLFTVIEKGSIYALVAVALNLLNGFTGLFSLGQAGFMLIGGYTYAVLTIPAGMRLNVYQYFDGGWIKFSIPEVVGNALGGVMGQTGYAIGEFIGMLIPMILAEIGRAHV